MLVELAYGRGQVPVQVPDDATVIAPAFLPGLPDERAAVARALEDPIRAAPLRDWVRPTDRICIVFTDITRATPNERLIPWLLEVLSHIPRERNTLLNALGTHRPNSLAELERLLTPEVVRQYRVLNHEPENPAALTRFGDTRDGTPALINRHFAEADVRIVTGFIEPHFFAGFSGGPKGIMPGIAGLETVMSHHGARNLSSPLATFGITRGNPLWEELTEIALRTGPAFLLNVALNERREITGVFAGDLLAAHAAGCDFVRASAMRKVPAPFDLVLTSNSGAPLDLNLYQGVKGMSAAARIVKPGGCILLACECPDGVPAGSSYDRLLRGAPSPAALLAQFAASHSTRPEQWQAQIQAGIQARARVFLYSRLAPDLVRAAHLEPVANLQPWVDTFLAEHPRASVAVLPQGPLTIPYLDSPAEPAAQTSPTHP